MAIDAERVDVFRQPCSSTLERCAFWTFELQLHTCIQHGKPYCRARRRGQDRQNTPLGGDRKSFSRGLPYPNCVDVLKFGGIASAMAAVRASQIDHQEGVLGIPMSPTSATTQNTAPAKSVAAAPNLSHSSPATPLASRRAIPLIKLKNP